MGDLIAFQLKAFSGFTYYFLSCRETRKENESILQKMLIVSTQNDAKFAAITSDMLTAVKGNTST